MAADTSTDHVRQLRENLLRRNIANNVGLVSTTGSAFAAHADAAVNAWWAYRLLDALAEIAPDRLPALVKDISEELEFGGAHEASYEAAQSLGIDVNDLEKRMRAKLAQRA